MELNLHRLRMFREVARHDGVTAAAAAMHYSPSGISQQLTALENDVGAPILERVGRKVRLTEVGRVLLDQAEILLNAERDAQVAIEKVRETLAVRLTVGVFSTVAAGLIPPILNDLAEYHPEIQLITRESDPEAAVTDLRHGKLDLAFLVDYPDAAEPWPADITLVPMGLDQFHLAAPTGLLTGPTVRLADLADHDWILSSTQTYYGRAVRAACHRAGFDLRITHQVDEQATALAMVAAGLGISLMSNLGESFRPPNVDVLDLDEPLQRRLLIAHQTRAHYRPSIPVFLASATRVSENLLGPR